MVVRLDPADDPAPVVVDSPHSGQFYPDDFGAAVPLSLLRGGEDRFVDELFADSTRHGAVLIAARFARTYLDPNRSLEEIEPAMLSAPWPGPVVENDRTRMGVGLVFSKIGPGVDIYDRKLDVAEVERRIEICWRPYHEALRGALDSVRQRDGVVFHLNVDFSGQTIEWVIPFGEGGGIDVWARFFAPYLSRHLPGHAERDHPQRPRRRLDHRHQRVRRQRARPDG
jgi:N-formylglutamate deformylase